MFQKALLTLFVCLCCCKALIASQHSLVILPQDGRSTYYKAFDSASKEIRIEICVLEDPLILQSLQKALQRGITVRVIVDRGKYETTQAERENLASYLTAYGGQLHLSNPIFPRSFPKIIIIDQETMVIGTACLDSLTFEQYRDYTYVTDSSKLIKELTRLFENDWNFSASPEASCPNFNPTPHVSSRDLLISPVSSSLKLVSFIQQAERTLDVTSELLGNLTLESELSNAVSRGVKVRLISPLVVNNASQEINNLQITSLQQLQEAGVDVHVTIPPETMKMPYMHARTAIADGKHLYIGSISLSPDSITFNREAGLFINHRSVVKQLIDQFEIDFHSKSIPYAP